MIIMNNSKVMGLAILLGCLSTGALGILMVELGLSKHENFPLFILGIAVFCWFFWQFALKKFDK